MSLLVVVTDPTEVRSLIRWSARFARPQSLSLTVLCCLDGDPSRNAELVDHESPGVDQALVRSVLEEIDNEDVKSAVGDKSKENAVLRVGKLYAATAAIQLVKKREIEMVVASAGDGRSPVSANSLSRQLLRRSPCHVAVMTTNNVSEFPQTDRVLVATTDCADDRTMLAGAWMFAQEHGSELTVSIVESDVGSNTPEIGQRELHTILRDASVPEDHERIKTSVSVGDSPLPQIARLASEFDLVFLGSKNLDALPQIAPAASGATIAVFRRAPPLRVWSSRRRTLDWIPKLQPADFADLYRNLRMGSRLTRDFVVMLGLAVGIAAMGLLQDSPAVVIGSMLLAPLMTPMVGAGLALALANVVLFRSAVRTIAAGVSLALVISFLVGLLTPGTELTTELLARGSPNILDLVIAFLSAAAGAYALARPSLVGTIAGVAIATALVPPLCTVGISLAYAEWDNALGSGLLFGTNLLAIILGAALVFRIMGVVAAPSLSQRRLTWALPTFVAMVALAVVLSVPLGEYLHSQLRLGRGRSLAVPVRNEVIHSIEKRLADYPGTSIVLVARVACERDFDVRIVLASRQPLSPSLGTDLTELMRKELGAPDLIVDVVCLRDGWSDSAE